METKYYSRKWMGMKANTVNKDAGHSWQTVLDLADLADGKGETYYEYEYESLALGDNWLRTTDPSGAQLYSIPIEGSGRIRLNADFTFGDQSADVGLYQTNTQFGLDQPLRSRTLTSTNSSTGQVSTDPAAGNLLTLEISNRDYGSGRGMTFSLQVSTTMQPIKKSRLKMPTTYYVMQSTSSNSRPNLRKALPQLVEARGRGGP